jgi:hypothetical protein
MTADSGEETLTYAKNGAMVSVKIRDGKVTAARKAGGAAQTVAKLQ